MRGGCIVVGPIPPGGAAKVLNAKEETTSVFPCEHFSAKGQGSEKQQEPLHPMAQVGVEKLDYHHGSVRLGVAEVDVRIRYSILAC